MSLYIPPGANLGFLDKIQNILDNNQTGTVIIGGDFNHTFDKIDRHSQKKGKFKDPPRSLKNFISTNNLEDTWRLLFPTTKDYTYYSHSKKSYSRIDFVFISKSALNNVLHSKIHEIVISDHSPVSCCIIPTENRLSDRIWRMNRAYLQDPEFISYVNDKIDHFITTNVKEGEQDTPTPEIIWDAFKAYIRGMIISLCAKKKNEFDLQIKGKECLIKNQYKGQRINCLNLNRIMIYYF